MNRTLSASAIAIALALTTSAASAADLIRKGPPVAIAPTFTWTGFYGGVNIGYGFGAESGVLQSVRIDTGVVTPNSEVFRLNGPTPSGVVGGGQFGYNWQAGSFVFGLETDFQGSDMSATSTGSGVWVPGFNGPVAALSRQSVDWFGTLRARVGTTAFDPKLLLYVTGGFAYGRVSNGQDFYDSDGDFGRLDVSSVLTGWTAGAGAEWAFAPGWSAKFEYLYTDLGTAPRLSVPELTPGIPLNQQPPVIKTFNTNAARFHTVRVGVNYHFDLFGGPAPVVAKY